MSTLEKLKEKAKGLEAKDPKKAIEAWLEVLKSEDASGEANPDLTVYNRIGDLYAKLKDPGQAADYYDRAVDRYAELGFHNNGIAMCNKVLRNAPARQNTYLKLAKLYAAKGFFAEAKQNFVEYAERMQRAGKIQQAFSALKEVTDLSPDSGLREMLEEHLKMYGAPERGRASAAMPSKPASAPHDDVTKSGRHKTSSLVFLDLDEPSPKAKAKTKEPEAAPPAPSLVTEYTPEPDTSLEIEATSLADEAPAAPGDGAVEGLERTVDFGEIQATAPARPSLRMDEPTGEGVAPLADLEPTSEEQDEVQEEEVEELETIDLEPPPAAPSRPRVEPRVPAKAPPPPPPPAPPKPGPRVGPPPRPGAEPPKVKPVVPKRPGVGPPPSPPARPSRKSVVEVPPLELEPDFDSEMTGHGHEVVDEPTLEMSPPAGGGRTPRQSGYIDLTLDESELGTLAFGDVETPAAPTIEELESRVADDPDDPAAHRALGEALIEAGERERGIEELDHAASGLESHGDLPGAQDLVEEVLRLDPNSVRHRQKQVEYAFKSGDKAKLVDAYLELADTLLRGDLPEKARSVYQRVAEHDPANERAQAALAMLAPAARPTETRAKPADAKAQARDAKMTVREEALDDASFVDLGAMILDDEPVAKDTRMKVAEEEPTGDEEKDFHDMLARFKQGIDENIEEGDFQSHYDLGVAFKEMGLLDEAIAEFQKALRAPEGKLKTSEALGGCFIEKRAYVVAESILRRALDLPASGDQERVGVLYWLGRALEELGKKVEARELYGRVFAVDIRFQDVGERVKALARAK